MSYTHSISMSQSPVFFPALYPHRADVPRKAVLILGANGFIGSAVASTFAKAQYTTLGLVRSVESARTLFKQGVRPIIGSASDVQSVLRQVLPICRALDVIVSATEQWPDYQSHFEETLALISILGHASNNAGVRPLVIFTTNGKDYGQSSLAGLARCTPQVETTPLNPPPIFIPRTQNAPRVFEHHNSFDAVITRPTNVHGRSSSYYGLLIQLAQRAKKANIRLTFPGDPRTIVQSLHVDDCAEAYLALAEHSNRREIAGQVFNISTGQKYETLAQVAKAITQVFGLTHPVQCVAPNPSDVSTSGTLFSWSQWVCSEKIRQVTGWSDKRPTFAQGMSLYKQEYEEAMRVDDETAKRVLELNSDAIGHLLSIS